jgi:hypothetical protein
MVERYASIYEELLPGCSVRGDGQGHRVRA